METKIYLVMMKKDNVQIVTAVFSNEEKANNCANYWMKQFRGTGKIYWVEEETIDRFADCF